MFCFHVSCISVIAAVNDFNELPFGYHS
jgi:hypothetical protein